MTWPSGDERKRGLWIWCCLAVAVLGVGLLLVGMAVRPPGLVASVPVAPVDPGGRDLRDIRSHNSPSIARKPGHPDVVAMVNRVDSPVFACALNVSNDGGATWRSRPVPLPSEGARCFAPDAAFTGDGTLHVSFVTLTGVGNVPEAVWMASSNAALELAPPRRVAEGLAFQVRLAAEPEAAGRLYLTWVAATEVSTLSFSGVGNPITIIRSDDGGATWSVPVRVSPEDRARVLAPSIAIARDGTVLITYLDLGADALDYNGGHQGRGGDPYGGTWALVVSRSSDRGTTWTESVAESQLVPYARFIAFTPPSPTLAIDGRRIYVAFTDGRSGDADVWVWTSVDGGRSWRQPKRINDNRPGDSTSQYLPGVDVAPGGRVDVIYYDRRSDAEDVANEVSLQSSFDRGSTFGTRVKLSDRSFSSRIGIGSERGMPELGSRLAVDSTDSGSLGAWSDTRAGTEASNKQDLARARLDLTGDPRLARWRLHLTAGGALLFIVGLAAASTGLRKRPRRGRARSRDA